MSVGFGFSLPALAQYGGGGNNPFGQLGPTLDLSFVDGATGVTDLFDPNGYTLNTNFIAPEYQVAAQYTIWETNVGLVSKAFGDIITFTRASTVATYFNSAGVLTTASTNVPRFDYDPVTLAAQGLLIEEARTNSIRNNTMVGAVAGTPGTAPTNYTLSSGGGVTRNIVGVGTENGITYIDVQFSSAGANNFVITPEPGTQIAALLGQTWASSFYVRLIGGTLTNLAIDHNIQENSAAGAFLAATITGFTPTSASLVSQRNTITRTLNNASTAFVQSYIRGVASGAYDITLRIGLPQLEQGAFATSVIPTTNAAPLGVLRAADVASVNTLSPWFNSASGTLYGEFVVPQLGRAGRVAAIDDGSLSNMIDVTTSVANGLAIEAIAAGSYGGFALAVGAITANNTQKAAATYSTSANETVSLNAGPVGSSSVTLPSVSLTRLLLGRQSNGVELCGWLRRFTYYPRVLTNLELQQITLPTGATITTQDYSFDSNFTGNTVAIGS